MKKSFNFKKKQSKKDFVQYGQKIREIGNSVLFKILAMTAGFS